MGHDRKTTEIFGKCYRLMHRVGAAMGDQFFAGLWSRESDGLLSDFIVFLKKRGETLAQAAAKKISSEVQEQPVALSNSQKIVYSKDFLQSGLTDWQHHVAQYRRLLNKRIEKILELLEIIKHIGQTNATTPLLLERELLKLQLAILDSTSSPKQLKNQKDRRAPLEIARARSEFLSLTGRATESSKSQSPAAKEPKLSAVHKEILDFIRSRGLPSSKMGLGEQVQNTEIFARFGNIHRRTLKRKLSDLVLATSVKRISRGKKVFYSL